MSRDIIRDIFFDEWGGLKIIWEFLLGLGCIALFVGALIWALSTHATVYTKEEYEIVQNFQAKCMSAGGVLGKNKCYKDGELIDSIGSEE